MPVARWGRRQRRRARARETPPSAAARRVGTGVGHGMYIDIRTLTRSLAASGGAWLWVWLRSARWPLVTALLLPAPAAGATAAVRGPVPTRRVSQQSNRARVASTKPQTDPAVTLTLAVRTLIDGGQPQVAPRVAVGSPSAQYVTLKLGESCVGGGVAARLVSTT